MSSLVLLLLLLMLMLMVLLTVRLYTGIVKVMRDGNLRIGLS